MCDFSNRPVCWSRTDCPLSIPQKMFGFGVLGIMGRARTDAAFWTVGIIEKVGGHCIHSKLKK